MVIQQLIEVQPQSASELLSLSDRLSIYKKCLASELSDEVLVPQTTQKILAKFTTGLPKKKEKKMAKRLKTLSS